MTKITPSIFEPIKQKFITIIDEVTFNKEVSFAVQILSKNSYLASASQNSVLESVLNVAQIGLTLSPAMKMAYLVPRFVGGSVSCCLEPSYQGLCKLVTDTGSVKNIYAHLIYENDTFIQKLGTKNEIEHSPKLSDRGGIIGVYAVAVLFDGRTQTEVMNIDEVNTIRDRSEGYKAFKNGKAKSCIWESDKAEMCRKTVIKRLTKYLPKTDNWEKVARAIELTNSDFEADNYQLDLIEQLIQSSSLPMEKQEFHLRNLNSLTREQANDLIFILKENQVSRIDAGLYYSQTDIKDKLKQF